VGTTMRLWLPEAEASADEAAEPTAAATAGQPLAS
jgi:hypothetical protein